MVRSAAGDTLQMQRHLICSSTLSHLHIRRRMTKGLRHQQRAMSTPEGKFKQTGSTAAGLSLSSLQSRRAAKTLVLNK